MKSRGVIFLAATFLLALAAWQVHRNRPPDFHSQEVHAQGAVEADAVPEKYRDTVRKGLEYLVKNQAKDGHWEGDGGKHPVAMTGLVGLALLMERNGPRGGTQLGANAMGEAKYAAEIRKATEWLMDQSQAKRDGLIFSEHPSETARYMQGHGLATLLMAGAYEGERDEARRKKLHDVLTRAVKYVVKAQSTQGGWYETSKVEGHDLAAISATVTQIQALQAAENAGIPVPGETIDQAQEFLNNALAKVVEKAKPEQGRSRAADMAAALACRYSEDRGRRSRDETKDELRDKWHRFCQSEIPVGDIKFGRDEPIHYYYAQAMFNLGGKPWSSYRTAMFDNLQTSQNRDGSWPAGDGIGVGALYSTAVWCIVLQLDKKSHPSMRRPGASGIITRGLDRWPGPGLRFAMKSFGKSAA